MEWLSQGFLFLVKGGPVMMLLIACSLAVVGIGAERLLFYREASRHGADFIPQVAQFLEQGDWEALDRYCREQKHLLARLTEKSVLAYQSATPYLQNVLDGEMFLAAGQLKRNLRHLDTLVTIAPLLGLLGTIIGMMESFSILHLKSGQPLSITGGVSEALIATAVGLCIATLAMLMYSYFNHRLDAILEDMEALCIVILTRAQKEPGHEIA